MKMLRTDLPCQISTVMMDDEVACSPASSPISSLPFEVLSSIFEAGRHLSASATSLCPFEVLVSHVTKYWRDVALNTPRLWTRLRLHCGRASTINKANIYLLRSNDLLLDLHLEKIVLHRWHVPGIIQFQQIYNRHLHRWRSLHVDDNRYISLYGLIYGLEWSSSNIQHLEICLRRNAEDIMFETSNINFKFAMLAVTPSITSVRLRGIGIRPPITTITTLELYHPLRGMRVNSNKLMEMLHGLLSLKHLVICADVIEIWEECHIDLPSLQSLHLRADDGNEWYLHHFLKSISAPILHSLLLEITQRIHVENLIFAPLMCSSIRSLTLSLPKLDLPFGPSTWLSLISTFPGVTHLTVMYNALESLVNYMKMVMERLWVARWANLHTLTMISGYEHVAFDLRGMVSAMIEQSISKLQLSPSIINAIADGDLDWLRKRIEVETSTMYPELSKNSCSTPYVVSCPDDED